MLRCWCCCHPAGSRYKKGEQAVRMLLTPYIQHDLGVVLLKPGSELLSSFRRTPRVLICDEPKHLRQAASGLLPDEAQNLAYREEVKAFLIRDEVIAAAGGRDNLRHWTGMIAACQWHDKSECHRELKTAAYGDWYIRLCWHHDFIFTDHVTQALDSIATSNVIDCVLTQIIGDLQLPAGHQLTIPELFAWSVIKKVSDKLPEAIAASLLKRPKPTIPTGPQKSSAIRPYDDRASIELAGAVDIARQHWDVLPKPAVKIIGDAEPPQSFMLRPKLKRWECENYTKWVKAQPCAGCGNRADDPHHIISHGAGGMGTKTHDLFVIPLCRICHDSLHKDAKAWEQRHGCQVDLLFRFLDRALGIGAILRSAK